ncbi:MAG: MotA/TolQ/ExbB proton channel family protein [Planctomycetia bacterium]|jgi:biopolymer transport protein ExbB|nr:MotA/TolQ/ExbB proton channel family protein [Planctomycetia bacterium]
MNNIQSLWELFLAGGFLMWPIVAMSVVVVAFGIERLWALRRSRFVPRPLLDALGKLPPEGPFDPRKVYRLAQEHPSVLSDVIKAMLEKLGRPLPEVEHAVDAAKEREASKLYANIRPISLAVSVTPLLGLLGTVQGMILAFYTTANLQAGANRAAELAQGIYVALITTFAGLCVAIPASMIAHFLEGRILAGFRRVDEVVGGLLPQLERYENKGRVTPAQLAAEPPVTPAHPAQGRKP